MANDTNRGVELKKGEPVDRALKRLKTKLDSEGILEEMRRRRAFETPTDRFQRKLRTASKRNKIRWQYNYKGGKTDDDDSKDDKSSASS
jgi:small subunit ribosomal protein S21